MNQQAVSEDSFIPFVLPPSGGAANGGAANGGAANGGDVSGFAPFQAPGAAHGGKAHAHSGAAGKPAVVLQRDGERVTGIRVECPCGQVIELACSY